MLHPVLFFMVDLDTSVQISREDVPLADIFY